MTQFAASSSVRPDHSYHGPASSWARPDHGYYAAASAGRSRIMATTGNLKLGVPGPWLPWIGPKLPKLCAPGPWLPCSGFKLSAHGPWLPWSRAGDAALQTFSKP